MSDMASALRDDAERGDRGQSRTEGALLAMRELIFSGAFRSGERISELSVAERTGISRTPIRAAIPKPKTARAVMSHIGSARLSRKLSIMPL